MIDIRDHRPRVLRALNSDHSGTLWRDVATLDTPWGIHSSAAIYRRESAAGWSMVVDEFGEPTDLGRELYSSFCTGEPATELVRVANKNQILLEATGALQLSPASWTTRFLELSGLYDLLRRFTPGHLQGSLFESGLASPFASLVELSWRGADRASVLDRLRGLRRKVDALPVELQALFLICDSDIGDDEQPFLQVDGSNPAWLNRLSRWRCWSAASATEDVFSLLVPPVAFGGEDIYRRPVWGATPEARVRQLCMQEIATERLATLQCFRIDYSALFEHMKAVVARARADRDPHCRLAGSVVRDGLTERIVRRIEFWLKFWSHHMHEVLILDDVNPDRVYEVASSGDAEFATFMPADAPMWTHGQEITPEALLHHWATPFCPATPCGAWDSAVLDSSH